MTLRAPAPTPAPDPDAFAGRLLRCLDCDLLQRVGELPVDGRAVCGRCGGLLLARKRDPVGRSIPLYAAALLLWVVANAFPFMTLELAGRAQPTHLISGVGALYRDGLWELAALVLFFVILFPLAKLAANLFVLLALRLGRRPAGLATVFRVVDELHPWSMTEIFLLAVLVAYAKLVDLAAIGLGPSLVAFVAMMLTVVAADAALDPAEIWEQIEPSPAAPPDGPGALVACHVCTRLCRLSDDARRARCPRCAAPLHRRKPNSLGRCWALVLAAFILYVPANLYPVMTVISFGRGAPSTILGGVHELVSAGMWPLALLVFFASVAVPMLKLLGLLQLLISVHRRSAEQPRRRTVLYRVVEAIGRWSMLDIFMLSILVALVRLGSIASIQPGVGAVSFAAVVVITMFAAMAFDPRLVWDAAGANDE